MMDTILYKKIAALPEPLKKKVENFIDSLTTTSEPDKIKPQFGSGKGMFEMKPGFDEPLDDFKDYMY